MTIHLLDFIMYVVLVIILWKFIMPKQYKYELGAFFGALIMIVFTIIYVSVFAFIDWTDIYHLVFGSTSLKVKW